MARPKRWPYRPGRGDRGLLRDSYLDVDLQPGEHDRYYAYIRERRSYENREFNGQTFQSLIASAFILTMLFGAIAFAIVQETNRDLGVAVVCGLGGIILTWIVCFGHFAKQMEARILELANLQLEILFLESEVRRLEADVASLENRIADS